VNINSIATIHVLILLEHQDLWNKEVSGKLDKILEILASNKPALKKPKREPFLCEEVCFTPPERKKVIK